MKKVILAGATGSLGQKALNLLARYAGQFQLVGLISQTRTPAYRGPATLLIGKSPAEIQQFIAASPADIVINVVSGVAGIPVTRAALSTNKLLLLGNKESLVAHGQQFLPFLSQIIPLDSEHNAIYEILHHNPHKTPTHLYLGCSGGALLHHPDPANATPEQALAHPNWTMGPKVTLESATLINKGLEIIEAHYLFGLPLANITAFLDPTSHTHAIVHFADDSAQAYVSAPDMSEHLENALLRTINHTPPSRLQPAQCDKLQEPDHQRFPGLKIVLEKFQHQPANMLKFLQREEQILQDFLDHKISFPQIFTALKNE